MTDLIQRRTMGRLLSSVQDPNLRHLFTNILTNLDVLSANQETIGTLLDVPGWRDLELQNSWDRYVDASGEADPPQFWKDTIGFVHVRGLITGGTTTNGTVLAQLPTGYRPGVIVSGFATSTSGGAVLSLFIHPNGEMIINGVTISTVLHIGATYYAEY